MSADLRFLRLLAGAELSRDTDFRGRLRLMFTFEPAAARELEQVVASREAEKFEQAEPVTRKRGYVRPIRASSDDGAIFELLGEVGGRMPEPEEEGEDE